MIKDPISITILNSYSISAWEKTLIIRCIEDNPSEIAKELSERLGISERTFYRKCADYGLTWGMGPEKLINQYSSKNVAPAIR